MCKPATLEVLERTILTHASVDATTGQQGGTPVITRVRVKCIDGQYHQVKRMLGECGGAVSDVPIC
jgi:16S rRNA U516 pseudouridylate synthase RsuA-like enzyme